MQNIREKNRAIVRRFNESFIAAGDISAFEEIVAEDFINHTAPPGMPNDRNAVRDFILHQLRRAMPDLTLEIFDMVAEDDRVFTHKAFTGTLTGELMGMPPTGRKTVIRIMDLIRLKDGKYIEHWSIREVKTVA